MARALLLLGWTASIFPRVVFLSRLVSAVHVLYTLYTFATLYTLPLTPWGQLELQKACARLVQNQKVPTPPARELHTKIISLAALPALTASKSRQLMYPVKKSQRTKLFRRDKNPAF